MPSLVHLCVYRFFFYFDRISLYRARFLSIFIGLPFVDVVVVVVAVAVVRFFELKIDERARPSIVVFFLIHIKERDWKKHKSQYGAAYIYYSINAAIQFYI